MITETLYALAAGPTPAFVPTQVYVVTTGRGRRDGLRMLFDDGWLERLAGDYPQCQSIRFTENDFHCPTLEDGSVEEDAHTPAALTKMGDLLVALMCSQACDPQCALHVSLAGGRKSMSYLAGVALTLVGRPQDRLSHVVVSDPRLERSPQFFYPPRNPTELVVRDSASGCDERIRADLARIDLVDVPFLRVGVLLPTPLIDPGSPQALSRLVAKAQMALDEPTESVISIDVHRGTLHCGGRRVKLGAALLALYCLLGERHPRGIRAQAADQDCLDYLEWRSRLEHGGTQLRKNGCYPDWAYPLLERWFDAKLQEGRPVELADLVLSTGLNSVRVSERNAIRADKFTPDVSRINARLDETLGAVLARRFRIGETAGEYQLPTSVRVDWVDRRPRDDD